MSVRTKFLQNRRPVILGSGTLRMALRVQMGFSIGRGGFHHALVVVKCKCRVTGWDGFVRVTSCVAGSSKVNRLRTAGPGITMTINF